MSPQRLRSPCKAPGCPGLATQTGFCEKHAPEAGRYDRERGTAAQRGYGGNWRKIRAMLLAREPLCRECDRQGKTTAATMVHHIDGNPHNNHPSNHVPLCDVCHAVIGRRQRPS